MSAFLHCASPNFFADMNKIFRFMRYNPIFFAFSQLNFLACFNIFGGLFGVILLFPSQNLKAWSSDIARESTFRMSLNRRKHFDWHFSLFLRNFPSLKGTEYILSDIFEPNHNLLPPVLMNYNYQLVFLLMRDKKTTVLQTHWLQKEDFMFMTWRMTQS